MADAETDTLIAAAYPHDWARAKKSKQRNRLRKRFQVDQEMKRLRGIGAKCGTCRSFLPAPHPAKGHICDLRSDFQGYVLTTESDLCSSWHEKTGTQDAELGCE